MLAYKRNGVTTSWHPFTIASSPTDRSVLKFGIKIYGKFTQNLSKLSAGDTIYVKGHYGSFTFDENAYEKRVFIAGGIGVTPFLSAIKYASDNGFKSKIILIYASQSLSDLAFIEDIRRFEKENENFTAHFVLKNTDSTEKLPLNIHQGRIDIGMLHSILGPTTNDSLFLLCGPTPFMKGVQNSLKILGAQKKKIKFESFATNSISVKENYKIFLPALGISALLLFFTLSSISSATEKKFITKKEQDISPKLTESQIKVGELEEKLQQREKIFIINDEIISRMAKVLNEKEAKIIELNKERLTLIEERATISAVNIPTIIRKSVTKPASTPTPQTTNNPAPAPVVISPPPTVAPKPTPVITPPPPAPIVKTPPPAPKPAPLPLPVPRTTVS